MMESKQQDDWSKEARIYEYGSAANPDMKPIPVVVHPPELHESGPTRILPFDISLEMDIDSAATSPNLMASFIRINIGDSISSSANATSQAFYVIRGSGSSTSEHGTVSWGTGDMFVVPVTNGDIKHTCTEATLGGAALYWIHDEPLMDYLGVSPSRKKKFEPTFFKREDMLAKVEEIKHDKNKSNNRLGVLLGNAKLDKTTKTLTHVLWSLLNSIPPNSVQRPHRHNSVALDLCVAASPNVYTLMGREIDGNGLIIDPIRCDWAPGGVFVTPPGWWHSHHNESGDTAWVLPIQDAGLFTHQRTLDIRFVDDELALHREGRIRGSAFVVSDDQFLKMKALSAQAPQSVICEADLVASSETIEEKEEEHETEEEHDDEKKEDVGPLPKRRNSIQVATLGRSKSLYSHCRQKSIQVGADMEYLKSLALGF